MRDVVVLADRLRAAGEIGAVGDLLDLVRSELGFAYHALVHHCDPAHPPARFLFLQNYPQEWVATYARLGLHRYDPARRLASRRPGGFAWADLPVLTSLSGREMGVLAASRDAGMGAGFTVPLNVYGSRAASCSFVTEQGTDLPRETLLAAELLAHVAYARLFDLLNRRSGRSGPELSRRERDCVVLVAQGKTDWEIGAILGLGEETVTDYLKSARRRFGVTRRAQLVVAALADGQLDWDDAMTWQHPL